MCCDHCKMQRTNLFCKPFFNNITTSNRSFEASELGKNVWHQYINTDMANSTSRNILIVAYINTFTIDTICLKWCN